MYRITTGRKALFSQYRALGLKVDEGISAVLVEKVAYLGAKWGAFAGW